MRSITFSYAVQDDSSRIDSLFFYCDFSHLAAETAAARPAGTVEGIRDGGCGGGSGTARRVTV